MTSLSRRKRPTTARPTTPSRTTASLLGLLWLAAGPALAQSPGPLRPLGSAAAPELHETAPLLPTTQAAPFPEPPPLLSAVKTALPEPPPLVPAAKPAVLPQPKTLYFQKDPAPAAKPAAAPPQQVVYQDTTQPTGPEKVLLPPSATNVTPPVIGAIKLQTEAELRRDIVAEVEQYKQPAIFSTFPSNYKQVTDPGSVKHPLPPMFERVEPGYVCYRRLYFEDLNSERYGWEVGPLQPFLSAAIFYKDLALWPYHIGTRPCQRYECSAGYCLPGDPVPYLLYPIEWSVTGGLLEAGTVVGLYALFP